VAGIPKLTIASSSRALSPCGKVPTSLPLMMVTPASSADLKTALRRRFAGEFGSAGGHGPALPAEPILYDPEDDITILRVRGLRLPALSQASSASPGESGAILGHPENGPFRPAAARLGRTQVGPPPDASGQGPGKRRRTPRRTRLPQRVRQLEPGRLAPRSPHERDPDRKSARRAHGNRVVRVACDRRGSGERSAAARITVHEVDQRGRSLRRSDERVELLEAVDVVERLELSLSIQEERPAELQVRRRLRDDVEEGAQKQQREYFLRKQMDAIRKELGESDGSVVDEYRQKIADAGMPDAVRQQADRELDRLERMGDSNAEASMLRTYLDWLLAVPWNKRSEDRLDPGHARTVLDADHEGLDDVKRRITEYLAVRKLRTDRGMAETRRSGVILTLIGPPGTGKTSIGESIARATGRHFVRMSLGGVRDATEIRGHRRTYIGALPGRLVRALRDAGTMNPVIMLDEVDKLGADWRGDPSAALLEVLDPAQNHSFRDHYLDVELDLSHVLFVATANVADTIPTALFDRMEVIRFDGYTTQEKVAIARGHLWPRQVERNGLRTDEVTISDDVLHLVIADYTREAGVRQLERELGTLLRKSATRIASAEPATTIVINEAAVRE